MKRLINKVALITGAANGTIGGATAKMMAREGAKVIISTGKRIAELNQVADQIIADGGEALALQQDVKDEMRWREIVAEGEKAFGKIDILINCAGIMPYNSVLEETLENLDYAMRTNFYSYFLGTKYVAKQMIEKKIAGSIVNIGSVCAIQGWAGYAAYSATKGAIEAFSKVAAQDLAPYNIRVNWVCPGPTASTMTAEIRKDATLKANTENMMMLRRFGSAEEVANAILFLASDESSWITATELVVDGGQTMNAFPATPVAQ